ncbi:hypothetical protein PHET_08382 [Paragonimus heterotremus]|uniref:Uncharacterized protein n=1 Tax=Paragonimus heterotremus TaxID=100268 RepID=A0A8J4WSS9_9TREM|nr:hypothetical protein PHET_08382 [Paragonimus heterotremus]
MIFEVEAGICISVANIVTIRHHNETLLRLQTGVSSEFPKSYGAWLIHMELEQIKAQVILKYTKQKGNLELQIQQTKDAIANVEHLAVRNRESYEVQLGTVTKMQEKPMKKLNSILWAMNRALVALQANIARNQRWLKAIHGWIAIYQDLCRRRCHRWDQEITKMRGKIHAIEVTEGFIKAVFDGGPEGALRDQQNNSSIGWFQPQSKCEKMWLSQRRKQTELVISQESCDRIRDMETLLRTKGLSTDEQMVAKKKFFVPHHSLLIRERELSEFVAKLHFEQDVLLTSIDKRKQEKQQLEEKWASVIEKIRGEFANSEEHFRKQTIELQLRLEELLTQIDSMQIMEREELIKTTKNYVNRKRQVNELHQEFAHLGLSLSINGVGRFSYFERRPNYLPYSKKTKSRC